MIMSSLSGFSILAGTICKQTLHETCYLILEMVTPIIKRRDTLMRDSISPAERLALTLRFLATG
jgi:hypothetical protein